MATERAQDLHAFKSFVDQQLSGEPVPTVEEVIARWSCETQSDDERAGTVQAVTGTPIIGKNAHDARLVAAMGVHSLTHLLTYNVQDFRSYPGITAVTPADILVSWPTSPGAKTP